MPGAQRRQAATALVAGLTRPQPAAAEPFDFFSFNAPATTEIYTLSLHDALPISVMNSESLMTRVICGMTLSRLVCTKRSEEHTSELQSRGQLVCRLLLEKKKR